MKHPRWTETARLGLLLLCLVAAASSAALTIPDVPLSVQQSVKPMVMLVAGKDHRFFYEAYNDASDIDGDGTLDVRFKPSTTYLGLFNPDLCYTHNAQKDNTGLFTPAATAATGTRTCVGQWSGNWLNYVTTSRIDALRVVLYGGMREVDSATETILRRAYIPQDAHSWAKEYTSAQTDGYRIDAYTPLAQPQDGKRHFFGNVTANATTNCATLSHCSSLPPWLSVVLDSNKRVWEWASKERPVLDDGSHGGTRTNYTVRAQACGAGYTEGCKAYPGGPYKPVGLLHTYGEDETMLFGLLSGSYDQSRAGGRLRKVVSSFKGEVDANTGQFTTAARIVRTFDALRIRDFNNGNTSQVYAGGWDGANRAPTAGEFPDWGNPIGEMMYEATRYFAGKGASTPAYVEGKTVDTQVNLETVTWDDPYTPESAAAAPWCARGNLLVISDTNVSYDSDQIPGAASAFAASFTGDLASFHAADEADRVSDNESGVRGPRFIGQSAGSSDSAPSPKNVTSLGAIRGIAPEEPTKQGSYYSGSVASFAKRSDLRTQTQGKQSLDTFVVALASPLPRIEVPLPGGKRISLVPFAKTVAGLSIANAKSNYQPTNQIVDFYVEQIANSGATDADPTINHGRYFAKFRINYEDVEQGGDHEMDAIATYIVQANAEGSLTVSVTPTYQAGSGRHRIGYIISGTTADGIYLEVQDEADTDKPYFLNTPPGELPGYCDANPVPARCNRLPYLGGGAGNNAATRTFTPGTATSAGFLKDPLWFAAKWGGFIDRNGNGRPDLDAEWDADRDGVPDTYLPVQNPLKLKESLKKALSDIAARSSSASNVSANSTTVVTHSRVYQAVFNTRRWSGDLIAYPATANGAGSTPSWYAADQLPAWSQRKIFMRTDAGTTVPWTAHGNLGSADQQALGSSEVFDYLRGNRAREVQNGGALRDRASPLGDIIHSSPFYDRNTDVIYVGANDGMLHAFHASDGQELFAFVPRQSVLHLKALAALSYNHRYLVDGDVLVSPRSAATSNKSLLFSQLGRGGKGVFSLDVTDPANFTASQFLWEYTPEGHSDAQADGDLGLMMSRPQVARLNNGKLALIAGNGYNSNSESAVLYVFIIGSDGSLESVRKLDTGATGDNGLAGPTVTDSNRDGKADFVFAGDLKGNVWKFDLRTADPDSWQVAHDGTPLFQARDSQGNAQPITAPMYVAVNDKAGDPNNGKLFVFFGTGAYFQSADASNTSTQTWYGLVADGAPISTGRKALRQRSVTASGEFAGKSVRTFSRATSNDMAGQSGWYLDLTAPASGERIVTASKIANFGVPGLLVSSMYPIPGDPCIPGGKGYLNLVDPFTGAALDIGVLDVNGDSDLTNDKLGGNLIGSVDMGVGIPTEALILSAPAKTVIIIGGSGDSSTEEGGLGSMLGRGPQIFRGRISWREIVTD